MKVIKHRCFLKLDKIALQKCKKSSFRIKRFSSLYYYVTVRSGPCCCVTNHLRSQWLKTTAIILFTLSVFVVRNLERPGWSGSGAKQWLELEHRGWSTSAWGSPLFLPVSVSLSLQGLKASPLISSYGLVWASSQNGDLREVHLFICLKKFSRMVLFHSYNKAYKVEAVLPL